MSGKRESLTEIFEDRLMIDYDYLEMLEIVDECCVLTKEEIAIAVKKARKWLKENE